MTNKRVIARRQEDSIFSVDAMDKKIIRRMLSPVALRRAG